MASHRELARLVQDDHTGQVEAVENRLTRGILGDRDDRFTTLTRRALTAWTTAFGSITAAATPGPALRRLLATVRAAVRRFLEGLGLRARRAVEDSLMDAVTLGARQAVEFVRLASGGRAGTPPARPSRKLRAAAGDIVDAVKVRLDGAVDLLRPDRVRHWPDLLNGIALARRALPAVRSHVAWIIGRAVDEGIQAVTAVLSVGKLWVSESDACLRCAAYAGRTAPEDGTFPGGLSWDPRQRHIGAPRIDSPPVHPHCRCRIVPWLDRWDPGFPNALAREAERAVAYGRPASESTAARLRAARELLRTRSDLLPDVEARARRAIRTRRFAAA
ncbi:hypothetical protein [Streptomyces sp. NPDC096153]|uniref:hypothetical protein n=1 Tax=Streptomyces sp. NPDC096153 TaxID=3155548 RepID=UPI00331FED08